MSNRDVSLSKSEAFVVANACRRRRRELERRLERTSYEGKPGMLAAVVDELEALRSAGQKLNQADLEARR